jgi:hypothetical protein
LWVAAKAIINEGICRGVGSVEVNYEKKNNKIIQDDLNNSMVFRK